MASSYFDILGIPEGSAEAEIKKAYRRLAMEYHPDKNDAPEAQAKFIEVSEAYEQLLKGNTHPPTDNAAGAASPGSRAWREFHQRRNDPEWRKAFAERLRQARIQAAKEGLEYYQNYLKSYKYKLSFAATVLSVLFSIALSLDYFIPGSSETVFIFNKGFDVSAYPNETGPAQNAYHLLFSPSETVEVQFEDFQRINQKVPLTLTRSPIFQEITHIEVAALETPIVIEFGHYLYDYVYLLIVIFLVPLLRFPLKKPDVSYYFFDFAIRVAAPVAVLILLYNLIF